MLSNINYVKMIKKYLNLLLLDADVKRKTVSIESHRENMRYGYIPLPLLLHPPGNFVKDKELRSLARREKLMVLDSGHVSIGNFSHFPDCKVNMGDLWYFPDSRKVSDNRGRMYYPYGHVVALDGVDATGKNTLIDAFRKTYELDDTTSYVAEGLGGTPLGDWTRNTLLSLDKPYGDIGAQARTHLMLAQREHLLEYEILPALKEGKVVLANRFGLSTIVYQGSEGEAIKQMATMTHLNMVSRIGKAAYTQVVLTGNASVLLERMDKRGEDDLLQRQAINNLDAFQEKFTWPYTPRTVLDTTALSVDEAVKGIYEAAIPSMYDFDLTRSPHGPS